MAWFVMSPAVCWHGLPGITKQFEFLDSIQELTNLKSG